jgi:hypothetical protein
MKWEPGVGSIRRSWSGDGSLEIIGPDDHFELRDYVIVFAYVVTVDLIALLFGNATFAQPSNTLCRPGKACFADPHVTIHNALLYLWLTPVIAVLTIAITAFWKTGRAVVAGMQAVVFVIVVILAVTAIIHAQGQQQELQLCRLGASGPCVGVDRIS